MRDNPLVFPTNSARRFIRLARLDAQLFGMNISLGFIYTRQFCVKLALFILKLPDLRVTFSFKPINHTLAPTHTAEGPQ
jgi:hypothetical protein